MDASAAAVVDGDDGRADFHGEVLDFDDFGGGGFGDGAAVDGEVLCVGEDGASFDGAVADDDGVAFGAVVFEAEAFAAVFDVGVDFGEGAVVEEDVEAFAGGEFAAVVLALEGVGAAFGAAVESALRHLVQEDVDGAGAVAHRLVLRRC